MKSISNRIRAGLSPDGVSLTISSAVSTDRKQTREIFSEKRAPAVAIPLDLYRTGQIPKYHTIVDTILNRSEEILTWHHNRRSNGPLEGINNLIQTLRRTAHGFTNPTTTPARGLLLT